MKINTSINMEIVGYTDNVGSHESNVKYGKRRAENAKKIFNGKDVKASRISTSSKSIRITRKQDVNIIVALSYISNNRIL